MKLLSAFTVDEKAKDTYLVLPPWLEFMRKDLEKLLLPIAYPKKLGADI